VSWKTVALGELCEVLDSKRKPITKRDRTEGSYPYYGATGIVDYISDYIFNEKLVLIGEDGAKWDGGQKTAFIADGKYWVNNHAHVIKPIRTLLLDEWLVYYFLFKDLKEFVTGLTVPKLNQGQLKTIPIPLPPLATQQKIVEKLDAIFAEIDKATAAAGANAKNSYALYSSAVDSIFGKLTDKNVKLSSCSDIGYGYTSKSSSEFLGPQYLRITDIQDDSVDWLLVPKINEKSSDVGKFLLKDGDIVFARTGATTGKSYLIKEPPISVFASYLIRVDVNRDYVDPEYLRHFFRSDDYWTAINAGISGAAQGGFNASKLGELSFPLPDLTIQKKIIEKLDVIETHSTIVKKSQENKVKELKLLRQSILKQAFNGELIKAA
jgi:type I restriction enzyme S subunit